MLLIRAARSLAPPGEPGASIVGPSSKLRRSLFWLMSPDTDRQRFRFPPRASLGPATASLRISGPIPLRGECSRMCERNRGSVPI